MTAMNQTRALLEASRQELEDRLGRIHRDRTRAAGPLSPRFSEQAVEAENDEVLDRLEAATRADLAQVSHALHRLDTGKYGVCETCGYSIEISRLLALPAATRCRGCAGLAKVA